jgi:RNA polymerase sigma-70 factor (sigma-E family)
MTSGDGLVLGAPAEPEPLGELFGSVFDLAGEAASRTPDEVQARLRQIAASAARPADEPAPAGPPAPAGAAPAPAAEWDVDRAVSVLYKEHYRSLVRLAALLVRDVATAEEVVQDSFVAMHGGWGRIRDTDKALSYLRQTVVNRSRTVLRHRAVVDRNAPAAPPDMPSAEHGAIALLERSAVVAALRTLPPRQREALVLRYYGNLSEAQIAGAMGISQGAVKSHTARAMIALRTVLEQQA